MYTAFEYIDVLETKGITFLSFADFNSPKKTVQSQLGRSTLCRRSRSGLVHAVIAMSKFILVLALKTIDTAATIKLSAEDFISLAEAVKLGGEVGVLTLQALSVPLKSFTLGDEVTVVTSVLSTLDTEALNVSTGTVQSVLLALKSDLSVSDLNADIGVAALLEVYLLSEIIVLTRDSVVVSPESSVLSGEFGVLASETSKLTLSVFETDLLGTQVTAARVEQLRGVVDASVSARKVEVQTLKLVSLLAGLDGAGVVHFLESSDLSPHFSPLYLNALNLALDIVQLGSGVSVAVALGNGFVAQSARLEVLLVQEAFRTGEFVIQIEVGLCPAGKTNAVRILIFNRQFLAEETTLTCRRAGTSGPRAGGGRR